MKRKLVKIKENSIELELNQEDLDFVYTDTVLLSEIFFKESVFREGDDNSDEEEIKKVIKMISNKEFDTDPQNFKESLDRACSAKQHGEYLAKRSLKSLRGMKIFKVKAYDIGFALKKMKGTEDFSEIIAMHNNSNYRRIGLYLIPAAIELGGKYLECFGEILKDKIYYTYDFEVYKVKENVELRNEKVENLYFMKYKKAPTPK